MDPDANWPMVSKSPVEKASSCASTTSVGERSRLLHKGSKVDKSEHAFDAAGRYDIVRVLSLEIYAGAMGRETAALF